MAGLNCFNGSGKLSGWKSCGVHLIFLQSNGNQLVCFLGFYSQIFVFEPSFFDCFYSFYKVTMHGTTEPRTRVKITCHL